MPTCRPLMEGKQRMDAKKRERNRQYHQRNRERQLERNRQWRARNADIVRAERQTEESREANRQRMAKRRLNPAFQEKKREAERKRREKAKADPALIAKQAARKQAAEFEARARQESWQLGKTLAEIYRDERRAGAKERYRKTGRESTKRWKKNNPDKLEAQRRRRRLKAEANQLPYCKADIFERDRFVCHLCGAALLGMILEAAGNSLSFADIEDNMPRRGGGKTIQNAICELNLALEKINWPITYRTKSMYVISD